MSRIESTGSQRMECSQEQSYVIRFENGSREVFTRTAIETFLPQSVAQKDKENSYVEYRFKLLYQSGYRGAWDAYRDGYWSAWDAYPANKKTRTITANYDRLTGPIICKTLKNYAR